jgi:NAD(P)H dehydrogenase (quinone)
MEEHMRPLTAHDATQQRQATAEAKIAITGATGKLGRAVVDELLRRRPPANLTALVRDRSRAQELAAQGVALRIIDYDHPDTLADAFEPGERVLLISSNSAGRRHTDQHAAVIAAAAAARVQLLAYTSVLHASDATYSIGRDHRRTEKLLIDSGAPYVLLRNGWYNENYTGHLDAILHHRQVFGAAGQGRIATAARADYAAAAATVLTEDNHEGRVYELSGDTSFTLADLAAEISRQSGRRITYRSLEPSGYLAFMVGQGVSEDDAKQLVEADSAIAHGELSWVSGDLRRLIRRPSTPIARSIALALAALASDAA